MVKSSDRLTRNEYYLTGKIETHRKVTIYSGISYSIDERYSLPLNRLPKGQELLAIEFNKIDRERIRKNAEWLKHYKSSPVKKKLPPVDYFCIYPTMETSKRNFLRGMGLVAVMLTAIQRNPQCVVLGLFHENSKRPREYHQIRIQSSEKVIFNFNSKYSWGEDYLLIHDWEPLKYDSLYKSLDYEKGVLVKTINESLISDKTITNGLSAPLISAPKISNKGGIAISSFGGSSPFVFELMKVIQMMSPPSLMKYKPPLQDEKGSVISVRNRTKARFAELPYSDNSVIDAIVNKNYSAITKRIQKRNRSKLSEYSLYSTLLEKTSDHQTAINLLLTNYSSTEISIPECLDELPFYDIDIEKTRRAITDDVRIEVAALHNFYPVIDQGDDNKIFTKVEKLKLDHKIQLENALGTIKSENINIMLAPILGELNDNFRRVLLVSARKKGRNQVDEDIFIQTYKDMKKNFDQVINHADVKDIFRGFSSEQATLKQIFRGNEFILQQKICRYLMDHRHSSLSEIHDGIKFETISSNPEDLSRLLDKLIHLRWLSYSEVTGEYFWAL